MIERNTIKSGDIVRVNFCGAQYTLCSKAEVLWCLDMHHESWGFKNLETGQIHYVSERCTVTKLEGKK